MKYLILFVYLFNLYVLIVSAWNVISSYERPKQWTAASACQFGWCAFFALLTVLNIALGEALVREWLK